MAALMLEMVEGDQARGDQMMCSKQLEKNLQIFERKILVRFQTLLLFANEYYWLSSGQLDWEAIFAVP